MCRCHIIAGDGSTLAPGFLGRDTRESFQVASSWALLNFSRIARRVGRAKGFNSVLLTRKQNMLLTLSHLETWKEGPSMCAAMALAIVATRLSATVDSSISVSADLNLRGELRPVGGLEEKARVAQELGGIDKIVIPAANYDGLDFDKLPQDIREFCRVAFVRAENMDDVLSLCLPGFACLGRRQEQQQPPPLVPTSIFPQGGGRPIHIECCLTPVGTGLLHATGNLHVSTREVIKFARAYVSLHAGQIASAVGCQVRHNLAAPDKDLHVHMPWFWQEREVEDVSGAVVAALTALALGREVPKGWGFWASVQSNGDLLPVATMEPYYVDMMKVANVTRLVVETSVLGMAGAEAFTEHGIDLVGASTITQALARVWRT